MIMLGSRESKGRELFNIGHASGVFQTKGEALNCGKQEYLGFHTGRLDVVEVFNSGQRIRLVKFL